MSTRFTIIVPTRDRPELLDLCLAALGRLAYPRDAFEVLVVDDGSRQPVAPTIARHASSLDVRCLRAEGAGPARARNLALQNATGTYVVFTDDDCQPFPQWLGAYDRAIEQHPDAGLGGAIVDAPQNNLFERTSQILVSWLYAYNETTDALRFFCSNNFAFPCEALQAMGGFDESFPLAAGEDRYLCARWLRSAPLVFVPDAVIEHRQKLGFRGFVRQQFRYGRGAYQFWQRRLADDGSVNQVQPLHFYTGMLSFPFRREPVFRAVPMSLLLILSQVAGWLGYRSEQSRAAQCRPMPAAGDKAHSKGAR